MGDKQTSWLKIGCLGCLGVVGLAAVALAALILLPLMMGPRRPEPVERELTHPLPPPPPSAPAAPAPPDSPQLGQVELPLEAPAGALRLDLALSAGSFHIEPGPAGEPLKVEADYDSGSFELSEHFDEASNTYRVKFGPRGGWFRLFHRQMDGGAEVRVIVPRGQPIALEGKIGVGQSRIDLGGLWLTVVDLELGPGEHRLEISEPLSKPLPRFDLNASMGETELRSLGNASPRETTIHQGVGEMTLDLTGAWRRDGRVEIDLGIGECRVRLPRDVAVKVERSSVGLGEARIRGRDREAPLPEGAPTLTLRASGGIGELRID